MKYGGHAMGDPEAQADFAEDVVLLKAVGINPVVVHGGGPQIGAMLKRLGVESRFVDGLRVTCMRRRRRSRKWSWRARSTRRSSRGSARPAGARSASRARTPGWCRPRRSDAATPIPTRGSSARWTWASSASQVAVDRRILNSLVRDGIIPVIAPIGIGADGHTYNINADTMAGAIAAALGAKRFFLLTDVKGVLYKQGELLSDLLTTCAGCARTAPSRAA
ncbi:acetylglutamate kinase [Sphingomonas sp. MMS24-JH45]